MSINGRRYDWESVELQIPGLDLEITEISYDDEQEKELQYAKGSAPKGYGTGNYKPTAKISMHRDDFNRMLDYCRKKGIALYRLEIPKIVVSYANDNQAMVVDTLPNVSLTKTSTKAAQGDKSVKVDLDLIVSGVISWNGVKAI